MSEDLDLNVSRLHRRTQHRSGSNSNGDSSYANGNGAGDRGHFPPGAAAGPAVTSGLEAGPRPFSLVRLLEILLRRWKWLAICGGLAGLVALAAGLKMTSFTAGVTLIQNENPNAFTAGGGENSAPQAYLSHELSAETLYVLMRAPEVFRRVSMKADPPIAPDELARAVRVVPERDPDFVTLTVSAKAPKPALVKWANLYADEVINYTKDLQASEAGSINEFLKAKLKGLETQLADVNEQLIQFAQAEHTLDVDKEVEAYTAEIVGIDTKADTARLDLDTLDLRIQDYQKALHQQGPSNSRLQAAEEQLEKLRLVYTDQHPAVIAQKQLIERMKNMADSGAVTNSTAAPLPGDSFANAVQLQIIDLKSQKSVRERQLAKYEDMKKKLETEAKGLSKTAVAYAQFKARQKHLEDLRTALLSKQQEAQLLHDNALGYFRVYSYADSNNLSARKRFFTVFLLGLVGSCLGLLAAALAAFVAEAVDHRIRSPWDLQRSTRLPVLATLGDLRQMSPEEQINWAFRTLTLLQGKLNNSSDETLVCGFISSHHGEGRSTWIDLLVSAANQRGMRVLTVATRPSKSRDEDACTVSPKDLSLLPVGPATTLTRNVLAFPTQVTEQFNDPQAQPIVHIPLPGWVWNLERRHQWRTALENWEEIQNLVLLIELPPASQPESVLLAEHLPQVIWLAESGVADIEETREQLETLRHARCNLVGAVLNRAPSSFLKKHFASFARRFGVWLALGLLLGWTGVTVTHAATDQTALAKPAAFSINTPMQRAPWQQRLTLGPGDSVSITLFGHPELARTNVVVGPTGTINYLQLDDFQAAGLTIDELRARLNGELDKYYVGGAHTIVVPESFRSKKYYILGKVVTEGVFTLDRPLTIIEAVARAKGLQTGAVEGSGEIADLARSFLVRQGKRVPIDLARLFQEGDLSQNIAIEPGDYLYFAPARPSEVYVLGEVFAPGVTPISQEASVLSVVTARGGFTDRAYRKRVLVVRGSLEKPEAYAVDTPAMLAGRIPDFKLQPGDIIYVNARPWIRIEELLDIAAQAFIQASVTEWVGGYVPAVFTSPVIPHP